LDKTDPAQETTQIQDEDSDDEDSTEAQTQGTFEDESGKQKLAFTSLKVTKHYLKIYSLAANKVMIFESKVE
jgi:hypothetical protein